MQPVVVLLITFLLLLFAFAIIARKGRELRKNQPLPPVSLQAYLEAADGKRYAINPASAFYAGNDPGSDVVISGANQAYEICIFYHRNRFAFQTPAKVPRVRVNGELQLAGYLFDGDELTVAGERFVFRTGE